MDDTSKTLRPWVTFAGCVLVMVVLYWAQAVLVPIALAILLTSVLTPHRDLASALDRPHSSRAL
jgi:predicted PurR-regulated permease PerM